MNDNALIPAPAAPERTEVAVAADARNGADLLAMLATLGEGLKVRDPDDVMATISVAPDGSVKFSFRSYRRT